MAVDLDTDYPSSSYEDDFYAWALEQAAAIRAAGRARINTPRDVDWENVAEELEGLARSEARELRRYFTTLLVHLLKWSCQPSRRGASWEITIRRVRRQIPRHLKENPALRSRVAELFAEAYEIVREDAADQTRKSLATFPATCPITIEQALDGEFLPD